ncbi:hypothetical protein CGLO_08092 [Colletotrichum gloeosporioides Cg-14]|uniref:Poly [ADP-ribose] polymerase n=1 Tax=Colletotrichum gloeosporioides (strain Cg-14) TaxID=1237896 RepID=T0KH67_COLGC|nr:hypothetical protein CGLO_08092 [Colletotrichum gloeosporioides Cg-14]
MPPRRSGRTAAAAPAAPAAQPLDGASIAISGTFTQKRAEIESLLTSLGATIAKSVSKKTTHLITTQGDFNAKTTKVAAAEKNNIPIVSLEWAQECESTGSKAPEDDFAITSGSQSKMPQPMQTPVPAPVPAANGSQNGASSQASASQNASQSQQSAPATKANGKKRTKAAAAAAQSDNESDAPPEPKKKKTTANGAAKGKKAAAAAAASSDDVDDKTDVKTNVKKEATDGQSAKPSKKIVVPVDEGCTVPGAVYIAPDGTIYDASLNQTNASNNNNKFYRVQLIENGSVYKTWTRWGRVGDHGQKAILGNGTLDDALKQFDKKFKDKSGWSWADRTNDPKSGKYAYIERNYEDSDDEGADDADDANGTVKTEDAEEKKPDAICTLEKPVQELMGLIFNMGYFASAMSAMDYDANKLPLGKLSKNTILRGFQSLKDLSALINDPSLADSKYSMTVAAATEHLSNQFYSLIPHAFGRRRPPIISSGDMLKKELDLLESLSDMKAASDLMKIDRKTISNVHPADTQYRSLGMNEMTPLDHKSKEFSLLSDYLNGSKGSTHHVNYRVQEIFRIERNGELERFEKKKIPNLKSDRRLLWHGSRVTNFGGILSQGLRIAPPEAPVTGYMFGKGIYLADMSSKSANYCNSYSSGGEALLLLCEAELGDPIQKLTNASYNAGDSAKAGGMLSTWGQGRTGPSKWIDASAVHPSLKGIQMPDTTVTPGDTNVQHAGLYYNEFIVYDVAQVRLRYLFRVKM